MQLLSMNASVPCCHISQWKEHAKLVYKNMGLVSASFRNFDFWSLEGEQLEKEAKFGQKNRAYSLPICPNLQLNAKSGKFRQFCTSKLLQMSEIGSDLPEPGLTRYVTF